MPILSLRDISSSFPIQLSSFDYSSSITPTSPQECQYTALSFSPPVQQHRQRRQQVLQSTTPLKKKNKKKGGRREVKETQHAPPRTLRGLSFNEYDRLNESSPCPLSTHLPTNAKENSYLLAFALAIYMPRAWGDIWEKGKNNSSSHHPLPMDQPSELFILFHRGLFLLNHGARAYADRAPCRASSLARCVAVAHAARL